MPTEADIQEIIELTEEVQAQKRYREQFKNKIQESTPAERKLILRGTTEQDHLENYSRAISEYLDRIDHALQRVVSEFETQGAPTPYFTELSKEPKKTKKERKEHFYLSKRTRKKYLKEIGTSDHRLKQILHPEKQKKKEKTIVEYTVYSTPILGRIGNTFCKGFSRSLIKSYPDYFDSFSKTLQSSGLKVLSRTYLSTAIFLSIIIALVASFLTMFISLVTAKNILIVALSTVVAFITTGVIVFALGLFYPSSVVQKRRRKIKNDLPFALIHMSAVAGSGAKPESIFRLIASSGEYKGIESEIKKIVNYINLFGYDMSTALKTVARTTPSPEFRDLLNGLVSTIESGGALKDYLKSMAEDAMNTYNLERKKYVQSLSTSSDIYTALLIAAPLLFMVTLAIINSIGGEIAGFSVQTLAFVGVFIVIPLLNIAFLVFLNLMQPEI